MLQGKCTVWIKSYKLIRNELPPYWVIEYIRKKVMQLKHKVQVIVGEEFVVKVKFSLHSEACYLLFTSKKSLNEYRVSFRSHDNYRKVQYDEEILLYEFKTWDKCEHFFLKERLDEVLNLLKSNSSNRSYF